MGQRKIIHVDMDAFFASVEQQDNPGLRGKPVIVGGDPAGRGVVAACSYEARAFGIHSAMSCAQAQKLCPQASFIRPRKARYQEISQQVMAIFRQYTKIIEPLSLDEAFLDVSENLRCIPSATWTAERIRKDIHTCTGLTASAGVSCNKFLAKVASDMNKPDGITVITPDEAIPFLRRLPVRKFFGVGRVTERKMRALDIRTGMDILPYSRQELVEHFGKSGNFFYDVVRGRDLRPVQPRRGRKSIGSEITLQRDVDNGKQMLQILSRLAAQVVQQLEKKHLRGRTLVLKVRYHDFVTVTRSRTSDCLFFSVPDIMNCVTELLRTTEAGNRKVRLLGITVTNFLVEEKGVSGYRQLYLPFPPLDDIPVSHVYEDF